MARRVEADLDLAGAARVRSALDPVLPQDYATKAYVDAATGATGSEHRDIPTLVHDVATNAYVEPTYSGGKLVYSGIWTDNTKAILIRDTSYVYTGDVLTQKTERQYESTGTVVVEQLVSTYTYSGDDLVSIDAVLSAVPAAETEHRAYNTLVHDVARSCYVQLTYSGEGLTSFVIWTNSGMTLKIRESLFTYGVDGLDTMVVKQYDQLGSVVEQLTKTFSYTGGVLTSISEVFV